MQYDPFNIQILRNTDDFLLHTKVESFFSMAEGCCWPRQFQSKNKKVERRASYYHVERRQQQWLRVIADVISDVMIICHLPQRPPTQTTCSDSERNLHVVRPSRSARQLTVSGRRRIAGVCTDYDIMVAARCCHRPAWMPSAVATRGVTGCWSCESKQPKPPTICFRDWRRRRRCSSVLLFFYSHTTSQPGIYRFVRRLSAPSELRL